MKIYTVATGVRSRGRTRTARGSIPFRGFGSELIQFLRIWLFGYGSLALALGIFEMRTSKTLFLVATFFALCGCLEVKADGIRQFANRLNASGGLFHDSGAGREVVYRSSGRANRFDARAAWRQSPAHAAQLPHIRRVVCRGNVCVGR